MPIYEYECKNCGQRFDKMQSITADPLTECALCGKGPIRRVLQPVGIIFKGSGWYITDNRKSGGSSSSTSSSSSDGSSTGKESDTPKSDSGSSSSDKPKTESSPSPSD